MANKKQSLFHLQTLKKTVAWRIPICELVHFHNNSLTMSRVLHHLFSKTTIRQMHRHLCILTSSALGRYHYLLKQEHEVLNSVPLKYIASYLGITPQTLSWVRKNIVK